MQAAIKILPPALKNIFILLCLILPLHRHFHKKTDSLFSGLSILLRQPLDCTQNLGYNGINRIKATVYVRQALSESIRSLFGHKSRRMYMINKNILEKSVMTKEELDGFYNAQFEPMEFPWLNDVKAWIEKRYDVKEMTVLYEFTTDNIHRFILYLYSYEQHKNIPLVGDNLWEYHCEEAEAFISKYFKVEADEKIECKLGNSTFVTSARKYLLSLLYRSDMLESEVKSLFIRFKPVYLSIWDPIICVLETKEKARALLLSEYCEAVKKRCFDLLKPYDDHKVLTTDDIKIFVDHRENKESVPMYSRWVHEMSNEEFEEYERAVIDL